MERVLRFLVRVLLGVELGASTSTGAWRTSISDPWSGWAEHNVTQACERGERYTMTSSEESLKCSVCHDSRTTPMIPCPSGKPESEFCLKCFNTYISTGVFAHMLVQTGGQVKCPWNGMKNCPAECAWSLSGLMNHFAVMEPAVQQQVLKAYENAISVPQVPSVPVSTPKILTDIENTLSAVVLTRPCCGRSMDPRIFDGCTAVKYRDCGATFCGHLCNVEAFWKSGDTVADNAQAHKHVLEVHGEDQLFLSSETQLEKIYKRKREALQLETLKTIIMQEREEQGQREVCVACKKMRASIYCAGHGQLLCTDCGVLAGGPHEKCEKFSIKRGREQAKTAMVELVKTINARLEEVDRMKNTLTAAEKTVDADEEAAKRHIISWRDDTVKSTKAMAKSLFGKVAGRARELHQTLSGLKQTIDRAPPVTCLKQLKAATESLLTRIEKPLGDGILSEAGTLLQSSREHLEREGRLTFSLPQLPVLRARFLIGV